MLSHFSRVQLYNPIDGSPPGSPPWDSPGKNTGIGCHALPDPRIKPESPALGGGFFTTSAT